jgi:hypothetical protein
MTGLNLLHLLVQNRTAEFHSQLEVLSAEALASGPVRFAVHLEQSLMEGAYNKVLAAAASETDLASTGWFTQRLAKTVQDEVAACAQAAYDSLPLSAAQQLLRLDSPAATVAFCAQVCLDDAPCLLISCQQGLTVACHPHPRSAAGRFGGTSSTSQAQRRRPSPAYLQPSSLAAHWPTPESWSASSKHWQRA